MTNRKLADLLAEKVMGWTLDGTEWIISRTPYKLSGYDVYSWQPYCDIVTAWAVVEKVQDIHIAIPERKELEDWDCFHVEVKAWKSSRGWGWSCTINNTWVACEDTPTRAICMAALKAVAALPVAAVKKSAR